MSDDSIIEALNAYDVVPGPALCDSIRTYAELLLHWNRRVSLTTVTDPDQIVRFHFGESMMAVGTTPLRIGRLADVGSGAGFPGVPIKLLAPDISLTLIEANGKKTAFLAEIVRELGLRETQILRIRMESVPLTTGRFDFIAARALGRYSGLLLWSEKRLNASGKAVLWLGESEARTLSASGWIWRPPVRIPGSERRFLLIGEPLVKERAET